jgi:hypothetical protein
MLSLRASRSIRLHVVNKGQVILLGTAAKFCYPHRHRRSIGHAPAQIYIRSEADWGEKTLAWKGPVL